MKQFFKVFFNVFFTMVGLMVGLAITVAPMALYFYGIWPTWTLWFYFLIIPAVIGSWEAFG